MRTIQRIEKVGVCSLKSQSAIARAFEVEPAELAAGPLEVAGALGRRLSVYRTLAYSFGGLILLIVAWILSMSLFLVQRTPG